MMRAPEGEVVGTQDDKQEPEKKDGETKERDRLVTHAEPAEEEGKGRA